MMYSPILVFGSHIDPINVHEESSDASKDDYIGLVHIEEPVVLPLSQRQRDQLVISSGLDNLLTEDSLNMVRKQIAKPQDIVFRMDDVYSGFTNDTISLCEPLDAHNHNDLKETMIMAMQLYDHPVIEFCREELGLRRLFGENMLSYEWHGAMYLYHISLNVLSLVFDCLYEAPMCNLEDCYVAVGLVQYQCHLFLLRFQLMLAVVSGQMVFSEARKKLQQCCREIFSLTDHMVDRREEIGSFDQLRSQYRKKDPIESNVTEDGRRIEDKEDVHLAWQLEDLRLDEVRGKKPGYRKELNIAKEKLRALGGKLAYFDPRKATLLGFVKALEDGLPPYFQIIFWQEYNRSTTSQQAIDLQIHIDKIFTMKQIHLLFRSYEANRSEAGIGLKMVMHRVREEIFRNKMKHKGHRVLYKREYDRYNDHDYGCEAISEVTQSAFRADVPCNERRVEAYKEFLAEIGHTAEVNAQTLKQLKSHGLPRNFLVDLRRKHGILAPVQKDEIQVSEQLQQEKPRVVRKAWDNMQSQLGFDVHMKLPPEVTAFLASLTSGDSFVQSILLKVCSLIYVLMSDSSWDVKLASVIAAFSQYIYLSIDYIINYSRTLEQVLIGLLGKIRGGSFDLLHSQGKTSEDTIETVLSGTSRLLASMFTVDDPGVVKANTARVKRLKELADTVRSMETLGKFIATLVTSSFWLLADSMGYSSFAHRNMVILDKEIPSWMDEVAKLDNPSCEVEVEKDFRVAEKVLLLKKKGDEFMVTLQRMRAPTRSLAYFNTYYSRICKLSTLAVPHHYNDRMRKSPFVIHLVGGSGVGKSTLQLFLVKELFLRAGKPYDIHRDKYVRNSNQDHWDGYRNQPVVIFDDFLQARDKELILRDLLELIHCKNTTPYPLKMANLEAKGCTRFTSPLIVLTSNKTFGADLRDFVASPEAIKRRVDVTITVSVKPEFATVDGRIRSDIDMPGGFRYDIYNFFIDGMQGIRSYPEVVTHCSELWRRAELSDACLISQLEEYTGVPVAPVTIDEQRWMAILEAHTPVDDGSFSSMSSQWRNDDVQPSENLTPEQRLLFAAIHGTGGSPRLVPIHEEPDDLPALTLEEARAYVEGRIQDAIANGDLETQRIVREGELMNGSTRWSRLSQRCASMYRTTSVNVSGWFSAVSRRLVVWKEKLLAFKSEIGTWLGKMFQNPIIKYGTMFIGAFLALSGAWWVWKHFSRKPYKSQAHGSGDYRTYRFRRNVKVLKPRLKSQGVYAEKYKALAHQKRIRQAENDVKICSGELLSAQDSTDPNCYELITHRIRNNLVSLSCGAYSVNGLFLKDNVLMIPLHLQGAMELTGGMRIKGLNRDYFISISELGILPIEELDMALLSLPRRYGMALDITKYFMTDADLQRLIIDRAVMCTYQHGKEPMFTLKDVHTIRPQKSVQYTHTDPNGVEDKIHIVSGYHYHTSTEAGDCGGPVMALNRSSSRKIIGFHLAGSHSCGAGNQLTQEILAQALEDLLEDVVTIETEDLEVPNYSNLQSQCVKMGDQVEVIGLVKPSEQYRAPQDSALLKSPMYDVYPVKTAPSLLKICGDINPLRLGIESQFCDMIVFPQELVDEAADDLFMCLSSMESPYRHRELIDDNAILNGIQGDPYIRPLNMKTSPGYPYILQNRTLPGKLSFVEGEVGEYVPGEYLKKRYDERLRKAELGTIPPTYFCDVLKDERRTLEKVRKGKTRVFNSAPMDLNLLVRKYFSSFIAHVEHNHIYGECSVGVNAHSAEWGMMFEHMKANGDEWIAGDYSKFDKRLPFELCMKVCDIINRFYGNGDNDRIRTVLFKTMFSASHITGRVVYHVQQGNPSGIPITVIINSLVNALLFRIAFLGVGRGLGKQICLKHFHDFTKIKYFGDDNIGCVNSQAVGWFNMRSISEYLGKFNVVYTPPTKGVVECEWLNLEDVTYLKRAFVKRGGHCFAPLELEVIQEMISWYRKGNDPNEAVRITYETALRELVHHGRDAFNLYQLEVHKEASVRGVFLDTFSYDVEMDKLLYGSIPLWDTTSWCDLVDGG